MKEISATKKVEVAQHYLLGCTYGEIEQYTGVSHGSIANVVQELENGKLHIPGTPLDQINDLHQLSLDLKKKGLSISQALNGLLFFERCYALGIKPEILDQWAALTDKFTDAEFSKDDFLQAAITLYQLEKTEGKSFEILAEEYEKAKDHLGQLTAEVDSLMVKKQQFLNEIEPLVLRIETLNKERADVEIQLKALTRRPQELKSDIAEKETERASLGKDIKALKQKRTKLSSEVDGKEDSLTRLNDIGFLDEDLLRLRAIIERIAKDNGAGQKEVKERFFAALGTFKDICELQKRQEQETEALDHLTNDKALLTGQIAALEQTKNMIQGQIAETASSAMGKITDAGEKAALELQQLAGSIKQSFDSLVTQAAEVGMAVGEMKTAVKKGEASQANLSNFIRDVRIRVVKTDG